LNAVLESEARLAAAALGMDPGLGVLHVDTTAPDSLACDLMEPVRPHMDSYLLDWVTRRPLMGVAELVGLSRMVWSDKS
jgi:CRISPR/Cas system-associated endonuclease Cas1